MNNNSIYENINIPVYVINLPERRDRLAHIRQQFANRDEFELTIIEACRHSIGAVGLWQSMVKIINIAMKKDDDVIIICEDDHAFTPQYSKAYLFDSVLDSFDKGVNVLLGGVSGFSQSIPISKHLCWVDVFYGTQFVVLGRNLFTRILDESFDKKDTADGKLSELTSHKMLMHPFISVQKDFGYSDVFPFESRKANYLNNRFDETSKRLAKILEVFNRYNPKQFS